MWRAAQEYEEIIGQLINPLLEVVKELPLEKKEAYIDRIGDHAGEVLIMLDKKLDLNIPILSQEQEEAVYRWVAKFIVGRLANRFMD